MKQFLWSIGVAALLSSALAVTPAAADEEGFFTPKADGNWLVRLRGIAVIPDEDLSADGIPGSNASISTEIVPELDITYFFTDNIAAELILATAEHEVTGTGALSGSDIGSVALLPPTLTLQYHVTQLSDTIKPYFGAGVNYTIFYNEDAGSFDSIEYDDTFGFALQAGVDIAIADGWYFNADVKRLFLETEWEINGGAVTGDVTIDPWIVGVGFGVRF